MSNTPPKQYTRDLKGLSEITWDMIDRVARGDKDFDIRRAEVVIKGAETIVKAKMAQIAIEIHEEKLNKKRGKVIEVPGGRDQGAAPEEIEVRSDAAVEEEALGAVEGDGKEAAAGQGLGEVQRV